MKRHVLVIALSLLLLSSIVFAVAAYIRPPFIEVRQHVKNGVINIMPGKIEVANKHNPYPVIVHLSSANYVEFDDNDFILTPGQLRVINFSAVVTKWGGYDTYIDATYRRTTGGLPTTVSAIVDINAQSQGNGVNNYPPTAPVIISPQSGTVIDGDLNLQWAASIDQDFNNSIQYTVIVDDNPDFSSPVANVKTVKLSKTVALQPGYAYYWKVIAFDGKHSVSSDPGTGFTENEVPPIPALISPADGVVLNSEPMLVWTAVIDPDGTPVRYDLLIDNNPDFSSPEINSQGLVATSYDTKGKLTEGKHYWKVRSKDTIGSAGYSSARSFTLDCLDVYCYNLIVNSPQNDTYNNKKFLLDLEMSRDAKYIYKALNSNFFTKVCNDCSEVAKNYTGKEGLNNLTIRIVGYNGEELIRTIFFTIDTTKPKVAKIEPKDKSWVGGTLFKVKYTENNLQGISLFYGNEAMNEVVLSNCPSGKSVFCSTDLDLSDYDGQQIRYYFVIRDNFRSVASKTYLLNVDTTSPVISLLSPTNAATYGSSVRITANISESVTLQYSDNGGSFKSLCKNCNFYNSTKTFAKGLHNVIVRATDKAGNVEEENVGFTVV